MKGRVVRFTRDGPRDRSAAASVLPDLMGNNAQQVESIGVLGLHGEHLPVQSLRFRQSSRLVMRHAVARPVQ